MLRERESLDGWAPLRYSDGRAYGIVGARVLMPPSAPMMRICQIEIVQRGCEYSYWDFEFRFYESAFARNVVEDSCEWLLNWARSWLQNYFSSHLQPPGRSAWGRPILVVVN